MPTSMDDLIRRRLGRAKPEPEPEVAPDPRATWGRGDGGQHGAAGDDRAGGSRTMDALIRARLDWHRFVARER